LSIPPPLSVVMPARNVERWAEAAVRSILGQTFADFELVILDDASEDGTRSLLRRLAAEDARIRLFEKDERLGPVGSSNFVVAQARSPIVARMDADDVAAPQRLARQIAVLAARPNAVMVGALAETIDGSGRRVRPANYVPLVRASEMAPFPHTSIMFRKEAFDRIGGYRAGAAKWEDIDLFLRMAGAGEVIVVAEPLISSRHTGGSTRFSEGQRDLHEAMNRMYDCLAAYRRGEDYTPLLDRGGGAVKLDARAFLSGGSSSVWAGRRPGVLGPMLRTGRLRIRPRDAALVAWATAAQVSPHALRFAMRGLLALRNRRARRRLGSAELIEWRPGSIAASADAPARSGER
jgi:glycosyltransferase involved in cell wall biosynthesis